MIEQCSFSPIYDEQFVETFMHLKKDSWNFSNVWALLMFWEALRGYISVLRSLLDLGYQRAANLQPIYKTTIFVPDIFQIRSHTTTLPDLFIMRIPDLWLVQFVIHVFLTWFGLTRKCRQVAFVNISYCEKLTLCLRVPIVHGGR